MYITVGVDNVSCSRGTRQPRCFPLSGRLSVARAGHGYTLAVVPFEDPPCVFRYTGEVPEDGGVDAEENLCSRVRTHMLCFPVFGRVYYGGS